jgi:hypothetical protein
VLRVKQGLLVKLVPREKQVLLVKLGLLVLLGLQG